MCRQRPLRKLNLRKRIEQQPQNCCWRCDAEHACTGPVAPIAEGNVQTQKRVAKYRAAPELPTAVTYSRAEGGGRACRGGEGCLTARHGSGRALEHAEERGDGRLVSHIITSAVHVLLHRSMREIRVSRLTQHPGGSDLRWSHRVALSLPSTSGFEGGGCKLL